MQTNFPEGRSTIIWISNVSIESRLPPTIFSDGLIRRLETKEKKRKMYAVFVSFVTE